MFILNITCYHHEIIQIKCFTTNLLLLLLVTDSLASNDKNILYLPLEQQEHFLSAIVPNNLVPKSPSPTFPLQRKSIRNNNKLLIIATSIDIVFPSLI